MDTTDAKLSVIISTFEWKQFTVASGYLRIFCYSFLQDEKRHNAPRIHRMGGEVIDNITC